MRIGDRIKEYREAHGLSQRAFARRCGLSNVQIAFLERGYGNTGKPFEPTFDTVRKVVREEFDERRRENQELMKHLETPSAPDLPLNWKDLYFELSDAQKNVLWKTTVDHFTVRDKVVSIAFETARVLAERMAILAEETEKASD